MFKDILVFILSFILLILLFVYSMVLSLGNFLTVDNITKTLKESDFTAFYEDSDGNETEIISSFRVLLENVGVPEETVTDVVNSDATKEFIGEYVGNSIEATINDTDQKPLSDEDVVDLVRGNMEIITSDLEEAGLPVSEEVQDEILTLTYENAHILTENMPSGEEIITLTGNDKINELTTLSKLLLSNSTKFTLLISIGACLLFLILLRLKKFRFLKTISAPFIINAVVLVVVSMFLKDYIVNFILSSSNTFKIVFSPIMDSLFDLLFKYGIFSFVIGIALIVIYQIQRKVLGK